MTMFYRFRPDGVYAGQEDIPWGPRKPIPAGCTRTPPPEFDPETQYVVMSNGWVVVDGQAPAYPPPVESPSPDALRRGIERDFEAEVAVITAGYTESEIKSWDQQVAEAAQLVADENSPAPLLRSLAQSRQVPLFELVSRVQANAQGFAVAFGDALGRKQRRMDELDP